MNIPEKLYKQLEELVKNKFVEYYEKNVYGGEYVYSPIYGHITPIYGHITILDKTASVQKKVGL